MKLLADTLTRLDTGDGWSQCVAGEPACERTEPIGTGPILDDLARLVVER